MPSPPRVSAVAGPSSGISRSWHAPDSLAPSPSAAHLLPIPPTPRSYDLGLIGGAMLELSEALGIRSTVAKEAIVGAAKFGAVFGTFLGGALMLRYGRRKALALESVFFVAGPLIMAVSWGTGWVAARCCWPGGCGGSGCIVAALLSMMPGWMLPGCCRCCLAAADAGPARPTQAPQGCTASPAALQPPPNTLNNAAATDPPPLPPRAP